MPHHSDGESIKGAVVSYAPAIVACVIFLYTGFVIFLEPLRYQWDFSVYYGAGKAAHAGLDPYLQYNIRAYSPLHNTDLPWLYSPVLLRFFRPFAWLNYSDAYHVWLLIKVVALGALFSTWHFGFQRLKCDWFTTLFFPLAFNGALLWDLTSGNASLLESLGLWLALLFYIQRRYWLFGIVLAVAAQMKFLPIAFLPLLLIVPPDGNSRWKPFVASLAVFFAGPVYYALRYPRMFREFLQAGLMQEVPAPNNATLLTGARDVMTTFFPPSVMSASSAKTVAWVVYVVTAGLVLFVSGRYYQIYRARCATERDLKTEVFFFVSAYALILPRMIFYSPVVVLMPAYVALRSSAQSKSSMNTLAAWTLMLSVAPVNLPIPISGLFWMNYIRLASLGLIWLLLCRQLGQFSGDPSHSTA